MIDLWTIIGHISVKQKRSTSYLQLMWELPTDNPWLYDVSLPHQARISYCSYTEVQITTSTYTGLDSGPPTYVIWNFKANL